MEKKFGKICIKHPETNGERVKGDCVRCAHIRKLEWVSRNKIQAYAAIEKWRVNNIDKARKYRRENMKRAREANPNLFKEQYWKNPSVYRALAKKYRINNPAKANANSAAYQAGKLQAIPKWANEFFTEEAYDLAQRRTKCTGFAWHVDHIVPLRSNRVCGLHVENNLRVIPARENISKGNRTWLDMAV